jgi:hypothetical protein
MIPPRAMNPHHQINFLSRNVISAGLSRKRPSTAVGKHHDRKVLPGANLPVTTLCGIVIRQRMRG